MPRPEKVQAVADIRERIESAHAVFVAEYAGLSVKEQQELRRGLTAAQSEFKVVKMTLARRAAEELGHDGLLDLLSGPTGLAFSADDAAATAKVLRDFAGDHAALVVKGALLAGEVLPPERVTDLANLEPRDVLLGRIAGGFKAPMTALAGLLAAMPRNLASMMQQLVEKKEAEAPESPEPEAAAAAEEPAAAADEAPVAETAAEEPATDAAAPDAEAAAEEPAEKTEAPAAEATTEDSASSSAEPEGSAEPAEADSDEPASSSEELEEAEEDT
jgi:large subunit ribosomal protein L10